MAGDSFQRLEPETIQNVIRSTYESIKKQQELQRHMGSNSSSCGAFISNVHAKIPKINKIAKLNNEYKTKQKFKPSLVQNSLSQVSRFSSMISEHPIEIANVVPNKPNQTINKQKTSSLSARSSMVKIQHT